MRVTQLVFGDEGCNYRVPRLLTANLPLPGSIEGHGTTVGTLIKHTSAAGCPAEEPLKWHAVEEVAEGFEDVVWGEVS